MGGASHWNPDYHAVSVILRPDPGGKGPTTISVRHPAVPFTANLNKSVDECSDLDFQEMIGRYLGELAELSDHGKIPWLGFSMSSGANNAAGTQLSLSWLPLVRDGTPHWHSSVWFERSDGQKFKERTLVLLAAEMRDGCPVTPAIRVVAHLRENARETGLRITSMSGYLPEHRVIEVRQSMHLARSAASSQPVENNVDVERLSREPASQPPKGHTLRQRSPSGKEEVLQEYLDRAPLYARYLTGGDVKFVEQMPSRLVRADIDTNKAMWRSDQQQASEVPEIATSVRSDAFSAAKAYFNSNRLFERFINYYIRPDRYFRSAKLPLAVHYRAGMPYGPGRDGQTINAAVQPRDWRRHQIAPDPCQAPPQLDIKFALGNRSHRRRAQLAREDHRAPAEPLGIVVDPRWFWHEVGHVLLMATTGELEMRFAHSPGDALAAIAEDPESDFVEDLGPSGNEKQKSKHRWRGATFPWVFHTRRHDRSVKRGWSWSGAMHRPLRMLPDAKQPRRKGYRSEQILSTSLFRLYLCLGGMTPNAEGLQRRKAASYYTLYLIIKGLGLLGDARIVPANHPDQLVSALIDADIGTDVFEYWPEEWPGGFAHKVIRWAFEAQGLYVGGSIDNNDRGEPPPVDVYIRDLRPPREEWCGGVDHDAGSYVPVPLEDPVPGPGFAPPAWFSDAIAVEGNEIKVEVGNRGREVAADVEVRVFCTQWGGGGPGLPVWDPGNIVKAKTSPVAEDTWVQVGAKKGATTHGDIASKESLSFGPFHLNPTHGARYLILAEASCAADRANTDPASLLSCSREPMPLVDLVANDNNLGLTLWTFSTIQPGKRRRKASR